MQTAKPKQQATTIPGEEVANAVVKFMVDCGMNDDHVNLGNLCFAFEYVYQPLPRFWRDFDLAAVLDAVTRQWPDWRAAAEARQQSVSDMLREVEEVIATYAFDETNAEMLMALPLAARPRDGAAASEWIFVELRNRRLEKELRFANRDGSRCGESALEVLNCVEHATRGIECLRLGTQVARLIRCRHLVVQ